MSETFASIREDSKRRRAGNREASTAELVKRGVAFEAKNHGTHLVIDGAIDFFPGTGLWSVRDSPTRGRGVFNLLRHMGKS